MTAWGLRELHARYATGVDLAYAQPQAGRRAVVTLQNEAFRRGDATNSACLATSSTTSASTAAISASESSRTASRLSCSHAWS